MSDEPILFSLSKHSTTMWSPRRQDGPTKFAGPAFTVRFIPKHEEPMTTVEGHYPISIAKIDHVPPEHILFVAGPKGTVNALYGGLMSRRAKARAVTGTVVDGRIRDIQEHRDLGYPVFARDTSTVSPQEKLHVGEVNRPVTLQSDEQPEVVIRPGDYLVGDVNGVVCLPQHLAEKVLALIPSQVEADKRIGVEIDNGGNFAELMLQHSDGPAGTPGLTGLELD
ncbi:MAG: hypothetical protein Q9173_005531 [Seirophora scorigena]